MRTRVALIFACVLAFGAAVYAIDDTEQYGPYYPVLMNFDSTRADNYYKSYDSSTLAWAEAYVLNAFMAGYRLTGDSYWLGRIADHADTLIANMRDVPEGIEVDSIYIDGYRGWGSATYSNRNYDEYIVHEGLVGAAIVEYIVEVFEHPDELWDEFGERAKTQFDTLAYHIAGKWLDNWDADRFSGYGDNLRIFGGFRPLPHNMANGFGLFLIFLDDVINTAKYAEIGGEIASDYYKPYIQEMAEYLRGDLRIGRFDEFRWGYFPLGTIEDISHANITIEFAWHLYKRGIVFTYEDMRRFGRTLEHIMWNGDFENVGLHNHNEPGTNYSESNYVWSWVYLIEADPFLFHIFHNIFRDRTSFSYYDITAAIRLWWHSEAAGGLIVPTAVVVEDDGDGVARPGETVTLHVTFKNYGVVSGSTDDAFIDLGAAFGDERVRSLTADGALAMTAGEVTNRSIQVTIPEDFGGSKIKIKVATLMEFGGEEREIADNFEITSGDPSFLDVAGEAPSNLPYAPAAINAYLPKVRHSWAHDPAYPLLESAVLKFDTIFWRTAWAIPTPEERDGLAAFLDNGGKLVLTGGGGKLAEWFARSEEDSAFFDNYFGITGVWNAESDLAGRRVRVRAIDPKEFSGIGSIARTIGAETWTRPLEVMSTRRDSVYAMKLLVQDVTTLNEVDIPHIIAGVSVDSTYTAMVLGWDFAQLTPATIPYDMMQAALGWLASPTAIQEGALPTPATVGVTSYPNPFNPAATVVYMTPASGHSRVSVYNVAGQHIRTIVDGWSVAGVHEVRWDGLSAVGVPVASGVYVVRHEFASHTGEVSSATHRMTLVR
jgi:hypothetical protein